MSSDDDGPVIVRRGARADVPSVIPSAAAADRAAISDDEACSLGTLRARFAPAEAAVDFTANDDDELDSLSAHISRVGLSGVDAHVESIVATGDEQPSHRAEPDASAAEWILSSTCATLPGGFSLPINLYERLFPYQREGVAWMWSLHAESPVPSGSLGRCSERRTAGGASRGSASLREENISASLAAVSLENKVAGGILADDMGLGKTLQTVSFLTGLLLSKIIRTALVVLPVSLLETWRAEFANFSRGVKVHMLHEQGGIPARARVVSRVQREGGVLLTTYGLVTSTPSLFGAEEEDADKAVTSVSALVGPCMWDVLALDEGHRIKNPATASSRAARALPANFRLLLSGTPIQNNLEELWALFDFVACGRLLDTRKVFNSRIGNRIAGSRDKRATAAQRSDGAAATAELMAIISPYMLRREKSSLFALSETATPLAAAQTVADENAVGHATTAASLSSLEALALSARPDTGLRPVAAMGGAAMGIKKEVVLWVPFTPAQLALYEAYLSSCADRTHADDEAVEVATPGFSLNKTGDFVLSAIMNLRMLATHPLLVTRVKLAQTLRIAARGSAAAEVSRQSAAWLYSRTAETPGATSDPEYDSNGEEFTEEKRSARSAAYVEPPWSIADLPSAEELVAMSGKLRTLVLLLRQAAKDGAKTLIFSQHTRTLDIIEKVVSRLYVIGNVEGLNGQGDEPAPVFARGASGRSAPKYCRIDGTLRATERTAIVKSFNADPAVSICLLTTGVGGLGLTLTSATRVILSDVSWNPATDAQAVDRAYRVGQGRDVITYRLITAGSVEEKMYRLQVFKGGLTSSVMAARDASAAPLSAMRFLSSDEIKNLFSLGATTFAETQRLVDAVVSPPPVHSRCIVEHLSSLAAPPHAAASVGLSHHDHLFSLHADEADKLCAAIKVERKKQRESQGVGKRTKNPIERGASGTDEDEHESSDLSYTTNDENDAVGGASAHPPVSYQGTCGNPASTDDAELEELLLLRSMLGLLPSDAAHT